MTARIFHFPIRERERTLEEDAHLEASLEWLLTELGEPASLEALRALAEKELKRPRDAIHKSWSETFLRETENYE